METSQTENRNIPCALLDLQSNDAQEKWLIVDVRTPAEFGEVHIPHSHNIPLADLDQALPELQRTSAGKQVLLVCRTGARARKAAELLDKSGTVPSRILEGGLTSWVEAGKPVVQGKKAVSIERQVRIAAGSLVLLGTLLGAFVSPWFLLLSGFIGGGLVFSGITDTCGMGLLLARLPFNRAPQTATNGPSCCRAAK